MILIIDNYDSFVHNIARYVQELGREAKVVRNDALKPEAIGEEEVAAAYLYGQPATDRTWPDSDIEIGLLFRNTMTPEAVAEYLEGLTSSNPLGESPGILMPFALNAHILPVIHEVVTWGRLVADNDPAEREGFVRRMAERLEQERPRLLEEAHESIMQARTFGLPAAGDPVPTMAQFSRPLDPVRIGWRFGRVLTSVPIIEMFTRDVEAVAQDAERVTQIIGTSTESWEAAVRNAVETASRSVRDLRIAEVERLDVTIEHGTCSCPSPTSGSSRWNSRCTSRPWWRPGGRCSAAAPRWCPSA